MSHSLSNVTAVTVGLLALVSAGLADAGSGDGSADRRAVVRQQASFAMQHPVQSAVGHVARATGISRAQRRIEARVGRRAVRRQVRRLAREQRGEEAAILDAVESDVMAPDTLRTNQTVRTQGNRVVYPLIAGREPGDPIPRAGDTVDVLREVVSGAEQEVLSAAMSYAPSLRTDALRDGVETLRVRAARGEGPSVPVRVMTTGLPFVRVGRLPRFRGVARILGRQIEAMLTDPTKGANPDLKAGAFYSNKFGGLVSVFRVFGINVFHAKMTVVDGWDAVEDNSNFEPKGDPMSAPHGRAWVQTSARITGPAAMSAREHWVASAKVSSLADAIPEMPRTPTGLPGTAEVIAMGQPPASKGRGAVTRAALALIRVAPHGIDYVTPNLNSRPVMRALAAKTATQPVRLILGVEFNEKKESLPGEGGGNEYNVALLAFQSENPRNLQVGWAPLDESTPEHRVAARGQGRNASHGKDLRLRGTRIFAHWTWNGDKQSVMRSGEFGNVIDDAQGAAGYDNYFAYQFNRAPMAFDGSQLPEGFRFRTFSEALRYVRANRPETPAAPIEE